MAITTHYTIPSTHNSSNLPHNNSSNLQHNNSSNLPHNNISNLPHNNTNLLQNSTNHPLIFSMVLTKTLLAHALRYKKVQKLSSNAPVPRCLSWNHHICWNGHCDLESSLWLGTIAVAWNHLCGLESSLRLGIIDFSPQDFHECLLRELLILTQTALRKKIDSGWVTVKKYSDSEEFERIPFDYKASRMLCSWLESVHATVSFAYLG